MSKRKEHPAYLAMLAESKRLGMPARFMSDLTTHDRAAIERQPDEPFVWCVFSAGTVIMYARREHPAFGTHRGLEYARELMSSCLALDGARLYEWDGTALRPCEADHAAHLYAGVPEES